MPQRIRTDVAYVFSLDSDGDAPGVLSLNSHLVNINSTCSQSYAINLVLDDTVGNAAIHLLSTVNYKLKIDSATIEFAVDAAGSSLTVYTRRWSDTAIRDSCFQNSDLGVITTYRGFLARNSGLELELNIA